MKEREKKVAAYARAHPIMTSEAYHLSSLYQSPEMASLIWEARRALEKGIAPKRISHGVNENYLLFDRMGRELAIFKVETSGESAREYAAFLLDYGFADVPPTVISTLSHPLIGYSRKGSIQLFKKGIPFLELSREAKEAIPSGRIRRLAILDLRLLNFDRHEGNLLLAKDEHLVPIDHSLILPESAEGSYFIWQRLPQSKTHFNQEEKDFVNSLDPLKEKKILIDEVGISKKAAGIFYLASKLLQVCIDQELTPFEIAELHNRKMEEGEVKSSFFERLINKMEPYENENILFYDEILRVEIRRIIDEAREFEKQASVG